MIALWGGSSGLNASLLFNAAFRDLGAGLVDLTLNAGTGSATYTGATSKWTKLSTGLWASVATAQARFCYIGRDTTVQTQGGYFAERAATQLIAVTAAIRDMTNAAWSNVTMTAAKTATGIDGVANSATTLTCLVNAGASTQTFVLAAATRTYGVFIKRRAGTGIVTIVNGTASLDITAMINTSTYTRVQVTSSDINPSIGIAIALAGDAIDVDFNQYEVGVEATSPIDTGGGTRNADLLTYPVSGNLNVAMGTVTADVYLNITTGTTTGLRKNFVATSNPYVLGADSGANQYTTIGVTDNTNLAQLTSTSNVSTTFRTRASSWGTAGLSVAADGLLATNPTFTGLIGGGTPIIAIGCVSPAGAQPNGIIRNVKIYRNQFAGGVLQALAP